ncbi:hypothetical protein FRC11_006438 [Ceratobasidium sp. 423]|nr:hypothetical protein FRC11_006438 [Ceratobasidium sp. 423]
MTEVPQETSPSNKPPQFALSLFIADNKISPKAFDPMYLNKISRTPDLTTPFDREFEEDLDSPVSGELQPISPGEAQVPELEHEEYANPVIKVNLATCLRGEPEPQPAGAFSEAVDGLIDFFRVPRVQQIQYSGPPRKAPNEEHRPVPALPSEDWELEGSKITHEQRKALCESVPSAKVLALSNRGEYVARALTSNLLYAKKAPGVVVITNKVEEIQLMVKFARKHDIPITVQNGGHSYAGYSLNYGGILINMEKFGLEGIKVDLKSAPKTATTPAGCRRIDAYNHFRDKKNNEMILGGKCAAVGVSGFTLGGGVSPFSRRHGLGIDSVLKMKVVTASGNLVTASREENEDLFWALRGEGGGNFGILTEFTTQLHDLVNGDGTAAYAIFTWKLPEEQSYFENMIKKLDSTQWPNEFTADVIWQHQGQLVVVYGGTMTDYHKVIKPLVPFIRNSTVRLCSWREVTVQEQGWSPKYPAYHHHTSFVFGKGSLTQAVISLIAELMDESRGLLENYD